jgi:hypothetical protein
MNEVGSGSCPMLAACKFPPPHKKKHYSKGKRKYILGAGYYLKS